MAKRGSLLERFSSKVDRGGAGGCWLWTGCRGSQGYGQIGLGGRKAGKGPAHRVAWELANGPIPRGMQVCHRCDNPPCVNPAHLFLGTAKDNFQDCLAKGRYSPKGTGNPASKLDDDAIRDIRALAVKGELSQREIANIFGLSQPAVSRIVRGLRWPHVSDQELSSAA